MEKKGWGEICHINNNQNKTHIVILHKVDFKARSIGNKEGYFIKIRVNSTGKSSSPKIYIHFITKPSKYVN